MWTVSLVTIASLLVAEWAFRQAVPVGLPLEDLADFHLFGTGSLGTVSSPHGTNQVRVVGKGMGPRSSGNHWVWVIESSILWGERVVAEGYIRHPRRNERLSLRWASEREIEVTFRQGMDSNVEVARTYPVGGHWPKAVLLGTLGGCLVAAAGYCGIGKMRQKETDYTGTFRPFLYSAATYLYGVVVKNPFRVGSKRSSRRVTAIELSAVVYLL
jgi:hypothetical protein